MVQFPASRLIHLLIQCTITRFYPSWVTPFGHRRITGCVLLPVAFRSLPRPSSPDSPKAFTMNSYSLDHIHRSILIPFQEQEHSPNPIVHSIRELTQPPPRDFFRSCRVSRLDLRSTSYITQTLRLKKQTVQVTTSCVTFTLYPSLYM